MNITSPDQQKVSKACIIWLHGLGADSSDMAGLAKALSLQSSVEHIFLDAPYRSVTVNAGMRMRAWYDIAGFDFSLREDEQGIRESARIVNDKIHHLIVSGYEPNQIMIAGFSQGGAIALYSGLNYADQLAGIISLSAYLPLAQYIQPRQPRDTPIFIAYGQQDNIVLPMLSEYTLQWLHQHDYKNTNTHTYPMLHEICPREVQDLTHWIENLITRKVS